MSEKRINNLESGYILSNKYVISESIYVGEMGIVYKGKDINSDRVVSIKEFFPQKIMSIEKKSLLCFRNSKKCIEVESFDISAYDVYNELMSNYAKEINILQKVAKFSTTVNYIEKIEANNTIYIINEFVEGLTLQQLIDSGELDIKNIKSIFHKLILGLMDIHSESIIHGDLKPDNIFVKSDDSIVIGDFGISEIIDNNKSRLIGASMLYLPPELLGKQESANKTQDVYSLGKILEVMVETLCITHAKQVEGKLYKEVVDKLRDLYKSMTHKDTDSRLTDVSVVEENFLKVFEGKNFRTDSVNRALLIIIPIMVLFCIGFYIQFGKQDSYSEKESEVTNSELSESEIISSDTEISYESDEEGKLIFLTDVGTVYDCDKEDQLLCWSNPHNKSFYTVSITNTDTWVMEGRLYNVYEPFINISNLSLSPGNYRVYVFATFYDGSFSNYLKYIDIKLDSITEFTNKNPYVDKDRYAFAKDERKVINWECNSNLYSVKAISLKDLNLVASDIITDSYIDIDRYNLSSGAYQLQVSNIDNNCKSTYEKIDFVIVDNDIEKPPVIENKINSRFKLGEPMAITWEDRCYEVEQSFKVENLISGESRVIELNKDELGIDLKPYITSTGVYKLTLIYKKNNDKEYSYINCYVN